MVTTRAPTQDVPSHTNYEVWDSDFFSSQIYAAYIYIPSIVLNTGNMEKN